MRAQGDSRPGWDKNGSQRMGTESARAPELDPDKVRKGRDHKLPDAGQLQGERKGLCSRLQTSHFSVKGQIITFHVFKSLCSSLHNSVLLK